MTTSPFKIYELAIAPAGYTLKQVEFVENQTPHSLKIHLDDGSGFHYLPLAKYGDTLLVYDVNNYHLLALSDALLQNAALAKAAVQRLEYYIRKNHPDHRLPHVG